MIREIGDVVDNCVRCRFAFWYMRYCLCFERTCLRSCRHKASRVAESGHLGNAGQESSEPLGSVHFNALYGEARNSESPIRKAVLARSMRLESPSPLRRRPEDESERSAGAVRRWGTVLYSYCSATCSCSCLP